MIVTFGEVLMRLTPPGLRRITQADSFEIEFGGAESNTAVSLAQFGILSRHITILPDNDIGLSCKMELRKYGVDTTFIKMDASNQARMGLYFYERGASQRSPKVTYDRANSSFARCNSADFDWEAIFNGAKWFHFTGITPALSESLQDILLVALMKAKSMGISVSCDLNYRATLWDKSTAGTVIRRFMPYIDLLFANSGSVYDLFEIGDGRYGENEDLEYTSGVCKAINVQFGVKQIALTVRRNLSATSNSWSAVLFDDGIYVSKQYDIDLVERIGGGDSFAAGFIYGVQNKLSKQDTLEFATAASCLKHTILGDVNLASAGEVFELMHGNSSGVIKR